MIAKYAIALAIVVIVAAFIAWAYLPARYLPGNRARHLRIRLHLRLHPRQRLRPRLQPVAALGPPGRLRAPAVSAPRSHCGTGSPNRTSTRSPRPRPLPAPAARPAGRTPAGDGPAPHL